MNPEQMEDMLTRANGN